MLAAVSADPMTELVTAALHAFMPLLVGVPVLVVMLLLVVNTNDVQQACCCNFISMVTRGCVTQIRHNKTGNTQQPKKTINPAEDNCNKQCRPYEINPSAITIIYRKRRTSPTQSSTLIRIK